MNHNNDNYYEEYNEEEYNENDEYVEEDRDVKIISLHDIAEELGIIPLHRQGITGNKIKVAVLDQVTIHPFFKDNVVKEVNLHDPWYYWYDDDEDEKPKPEEIPDYVLEGGHGAYVGGAIAGRPMVAHYRGKDYQMVGAAPRASLMMIGAYNPEGWEFIPDLMEGIDEAIDADVDIICITVSSPASYIGTDGIDMINRINTLTYREGIFFSLSAGSGGQAGGPIDFPAIARGGIAVGATTPSPFTVLDNSGRGPTPDGLIKPDIMSIGGGWDFPVLSSGVDDIWMLGGGTSLAAATVAGILALLLEAGMPRDRAIAEEVLAAGATSPGNTRIKNNTYGWGVVNAYRSYEYLIKNFK